MIRMILISDTHGMHMGIPIPAGDVLVHSGDVSNDGKFLDLVKFIAWFGTHPHKHKIFIAGNHDLLFEKGNPSEIDMLLSMKTEGMHYLNDSGVTIEGIKFWGSPVQPAFCDWAFNRKRGADIKKHWDLIPSDTDVLITHGPAKGFVDQAVDFGDMYKLKHIGCSDLRDAILRIKPKLHVCGHIHRAYGHAYTADTLFVNAAICNEAYSPANKPIVVDYFEATGAQIVHTY